MSGHSKWATIKRQKGAADAKRGTLFTKLGHAIALAVREGGKDPEKNVKLRYALDRAKAANMPNATTERAIKRGAGELDDGKSIEQVLYEGYGPGGTAFLIETVTDNTNRTAAAIRHELGSHGGNLGTSGSVQWQFSQRGTLLLPLNDLSEEQELQLIDAGADDIDMTSEGVVVRTQPNELATVKNSLEEKGYTITAVGVTYSPTTSVALNEQDEQKFRRLVDALESLEDVAQVTTNAQT